MVAGQGVSRGLQGQHAQETQQGEDCLEAHCKGCYLRNTSLGLFVAPSKALCTYQTNSGPQKPKKPIGEGIRV